MKLSIERAVLLRALAHVQSVVERRNTIPILSNVRLEAQDGSLKLTATDMDLEVVESVPGRPGGCRCDDGACPYAVRHLPQVAGRRRGLARYDRRCRSAGHCLRTH